VAKEFTDLIERAAGGGHIGSEPVAQLVRVDMSGQSGTARQIGQQLIECTVPRVMRLPSAPTNKGSGGGEAAQYVGVR